MVRCPSQFLFGGQTANFWADLFARKAPSEELDALRPFNSKDCDIWVNPQAWTKILNTEHLCYLKVSTIPAEEEDLKYPEFPIASAFH